jgi:phospholipid-binding lipoprotein MlaA
VKIIKKIGLITGVALGMLGAQAVDTKPSQEASKLTEQSADVTQNEQDLYDAAVDDQDPLEPINRLIFGINFAADGLVLRPLTYAYEDLVAEEIRDRVANFMDNLGSPITFFSDILEFNMEDAGNTLARMLINTTVGILGIYDAAAAAFDIQPKKKTFDHVMYTWGIAAGPYIVLPILGPSSLRDVVGRVGEYYADPYNYYARMHYKRSKARWLVWGRTAVDGFIKLEHNRDLIDRVYETSDPYAQARLIYLQNKKIIKSKDVSAVPEDAIPQQGAASLEEPGPTPASEG